MLLCFAYIQYTYVELIIHLKKYTHRYIYRSVFYSDSCSCADFQAFSVHSIRILCVLCLGYVCICILYTITLNFNITYWNLPACFVVITSFVKHHLVPNQIGAFMFYILFGLQKTAWILKYGISFKRHLKWQDKCIWTFKYFLKRLKKHLEN